TLGHQDVAVGQDQGLARDAQVAGDGTDLEALRHDRHLVAPLGRVGDLHRRQQAALRFRQFRVGTVLERAGFGIAGRQHDGGTGGGDKLQAVHRTPPARSGQAAKKMETSATANTSTDSTSAIGIAAQTSRAWTRALSKARIHATAHSRQCSAEPRMRREGTRPNSAQTSAAAANTRPPTLSQAAKLIHWIS